MIVLISCCKKKLGGSHPVAEIYQGDFFKKALAYARCYHPEAEVRILSAKHGVLRLDDVIEDYDETIAGARKPVVRAWAQRTAAQLEAEFGPDAFYLPLAGSAYRTVFEYLPESSYWNPLKGLFQGQQKSWLKKKLEECL